MSLNRNAARRDKNERALIDCFAQLGVYTHRLSGAGLPDLLCGYRGRWCLVEVKTSRGRLEPAQLAFRDLAVAMRLPWAEVRSVDDVQRLVKSWEWERES